jgi:dTDP-4-amino-4,6-dideoxygalactose transaminase
VYENVKHKVVGNLKNADEIMARGLLLGCHHGMSLSDVKYIKKVCREFFSQYKPSSKKANNTHSHRPQSFA